MSTLRQELNKVILKKLLAYIEANPSIRFGQALVNLSILKEDGETVDGLPVYADPFHEESVDTLKRMNGE